MPPFSGSKSYTFGAWKGNQGPTRIFKCKILGNVHGISQQNSSMWMKIWHIGSQVPLKYPKDTWNLFVIYLPGAPMKIQQNSEWREFGPFLGGCQKSRKNRGYFTCSNNMFFGGFLRAQISHPWSIELLIGSIFIPTFV